MTRVLPPLDMHAHINPMVGRRVLEELGAVVFAVSRSPSEFAEVRNRTDQVTVWGVGCHPGIAAEFDVDSFRAALAHTPFVGEIGLDRRSHLSADSQERNFEAILDLLVDSPRLVSVHSSGSTGRVLNFVESGGLRGLILHWWLGTPVQTKRAVELGCYFSINYAMVKRGLGGDIPADRILLETDHPYGDRQSPKPRQPGSLKETERLLAEMHGLTANDLREIQWANLSKLVEELDIAPMMPRAIQQMLAHVRTLPG